MQMFVNGEWRAGRHQTDVVHPFSGEVIDQVPAADASTAAQAIDGAVSAATEMRRLSAFDRSVILNRAGELIEDAAEDLAQTICLESGKPISEARQEASRGGNLLRLCASEGARIHGETLPIDALPGAEGKFAFSIRQPCGVVVAITPFNYPLLLVLHKVAPALAAGNAVILKPASATPLTALKLTSLLVEAGLPPRALQCITGSGSLLGSVLCADPRVRLVSFTGSTEVGRTIAELAGVKRLSLELGGNCPMIVLPDADLELAADAAVRGGYINAGQVCISVQRVVVDGPRYGEFIDCMVDRVSRIAVGDPQHEASEMSSVISEQAAERIVGLVDASVNQGARVVTGGERTQSVVAPTVIADIEPGTPMFDEEVFGPVVGLSRADTLDEAIAQANASPYGLSAGIFTSDISRAFRYITEVDAGTIQINSTPLWRSDVMPYGGLRASGFGKEGARYAVEEMTELKTAVLHGVTRTETGPERR